MWHFFLLLSRRLYLFPFFLLLFSCFCVVFCFVFLFLFYVNLSPLILLHCKNAFSIEFLCTWEFSPWKLLFSKTTVKINVLFDCFLSLFLRSFSSFLPPTFYFLLWAIRKVDSAAFKRLEREESFSLTNTAKPDAHLKKGKCCCLSGSHLKYSDAFSVLSAAYRKSSHLSHLPSLKRNKMLE